MGGNILTVLLKLVSENKRWVKLPSLYKCRKCGKYYEAWGGSFTAIQPHPRLYKECVTEEYGSIENHIRIWSRKGASGEV